MAKPKNAKTIQIPNVQKKTRISEPKIGDHPLAWRFSGCDRQGPFGWDALQPSDKYKEVIEKLHEFEGKSWNDLLAGGSHPIEIHRLEKLARDRLIAIQKDDIDELMSFRLTGTNRVWCEMRPDCAHIMRVLWWDPEHQVYIVLKDKADQAKRRNR